MSEYTMDEPTETGYKSVNANGALHLGKSFAGEQVEFAVRVVDDD